MTWTIGYELVEQLRCQSIFQATMPTVGKEDEPLTPAQMAINAVKVLFALSPLLALFYVLLSGFESDDKEKAKRIKKGFSLDGHAE